MNKVKFVCLMIGMGCQVKLVDKINLPEVPLAAQASQLQKINQLKSAQGQVNSVSWQTHEDSTQKDLFDLRLSVDAKSNPRWFLLSALEAASPSLMPQDPKRTSHPSAKIMQLLPSETQMFRVAQGSRWQLTVFCSQDEVATECGQTQIQIPSVLILKGAHALKQDFVWQGDFVILAADAVIMTHGFLFDIKTQYLKAEPGAFIGTFKPQQTPAPASQLGATPQPVRVTALYAEGNLQITSRGQDGSRGLQGVMPPTLQAIAATAGDPGELGEQRSPIAGLPGNLYCRRSPSPGTPGQRGLDGQRGGNGGDAGGSGLVELTINYPLSFTYQLNQLQGEPGLGGKASPPQKGGQSQVTAVHRECLASGQILTPGGEDGKPASDGVSGRPNTNPLRFCVVLGSERRGCD